MSGFESRKYAHFPLSLSPSKGVRDLCRGAAGSPGLYAVVVMLLAVPVQAQLSGQPVSEGSGPVSDLSTNVRTGSRPVHERGRTVRESSVTTWSSGSVRESSVASVKSGTFSELSAGTVTSDRSLRSEKLQARLAPAPPRLGLEQAVPEPVYWEQVYELDDLIDELGSIEPLPIASGEVEIDGSAEPVPTDLSVSADRDLAPDTAVSE
jgi:hypothetical protein